MPHITNVSFLSCGTKTRVSVVAQKDSCSPKIGVHSYYPSSDVPSNILETYFVHTATLTTLIPYQVKEKEIE